MYLRLSQAEDVQVYPLSRRSDWSIVYRLLSAGCAQVGSDFDGMATLAAYAQAARNLSPILMLKVRQ
jgi:hypothetical protein